MTVPSSALKLPQAQRETNKGTRRPTRKLRVPNQMVLHPPRRMTGCVAARVAMAPPITGGSAVGITGVRITTVLILQKVGAVAVTVGDVVVVDIKTVVVEAVATTTQLTITTTMVIKDKVAAVASTTTAPRATRTKGPAGSPSRWLLRS